MRKYRSLTEWFFLYFPMMEIWLWTEFEDILNHISDIQTSNRSPLVKLWSKFGTLFQINPFNLWERFWNGRQLEHFNWNWENGTFIYWCRIKTKLLNFRNQFVWIFSADFVKLWICVKMKMKNKSDTTWFINMYMCLNATGSLRAQHSHIDAAAETRKKTLQYFIKYFDT